MKGKWLTLLASGAIISTIMATGVSAQTTKDTIDNWDAERYGDTLDMSKELRLREQQPNFQQQLKQQFKQQNEDFVTTDETATTSDFTYDGGTKLFPNVNLKLKEFTLRAAGDYAEVWVANDLAYGPTNPRPADVITQSHVDQVLTEFEEKIYGTATDFFGTPNSLDGSTSQISQLTGGALPSDYYKGSDKIVILIDNVEDEKWADDSYPFYTAGFFWNTFESVTGRNIITIDSFDWDNRLKTSYFSTTMHEFQHLIQADNDAAEESWLNEGFSTFSEYLGGYGHKNSHINFYLDHPENSLVNWDEHANATTGPETLADYGQTYLFTLYLYDKYGKEFIRTLATDGEEQGLVSLRTQLKKVDPSITLEELYNDFLTALVLDNPKVDRAYDIDSIDLRKVPVDAAGTPRGSTVNFEQALQIEKDGVPAWGGDFKSLDFTREVRGLTFNGSAFAPMSWTATNGALKAPTASEQDANFVIEADLTNLTTATLSFDHQYAIEENWDYGVVQVSTDDGQTWQSLSNDNTSTVVDPQGYPLIKDSVPGFTGTSAGSVTDTFDLSAYAGQKVHIAFRYLTDWGTEEAGWTINAIRIPELNATYTAANIDQLQTIGALRKDYLNYQVSFIQTRKNGQQRVVQVNPFNVTNTDALNIKKILKEGNVKMVTSFVAPDNYKAPASFTYEVLFKENKGKKKKK